MKLSILLTTVTLAWSGIANSQQTSVNTTDSKTCETYCQVSLKNFEPVSSGSPVEASDYPYFKSPLFYNLISKLNLKVDRNMSYDQIENLFYDHCPGIMGTKIFKGKGFAKNETVSPMVEVSYAEVGNKLISWDDEENSSFVHTASPRHKCD